MTDGGVTAPALASGERGKPMMPPQSQAGTSGVTSCAPSFTDVASATKWFLEHEDVVRLQMDLCLREHLMRDRHEEVEGTSRPDRS